MHTTLFTLASAHAAPFFSLSRHRHGRARCPPHILICLIILCSSLFVPLAWGKAVKDYGSLLPPGAGQQTPLTKMGLARLFGFGFLSRPGAPTPSPKGVAAAAARALEAGLLGKKDAILYWNQVREDGGKNSLVCARA